MKSKLFKHMSLPEMYSLDVDKDNKIYFSFKYEVKTKLNTALNIIK